MNNQNEQDNEPWKYNIDIIPNTDTIVKLCVNRGADKSSTFDVPEFQFEWANKILKKTSWKKHHNMEYITISCDEALEAMKSIPFDDFQNHIFFTNVASSLREIDRSVSSILFDYDKFSLVIQCAFRVHMSNKRVNILRSQPENLFHPEFSIIRKRKLNIDDSMFDKNKNF